MIKHYCDICEKEVHRNYVSDRLKMKLEGFEVEVMVTKDNTTNSGELCRDCLLKILRTGHELFPKYLKK